jgi:hypothetical protein
VQLEGGWPAMLKIVLYVMITAAVLATGWLLSDDMNRAALFSPKGKEEQFGKFGVSIGDSIASARERLQERGFERSLYPSPTERHCLGEALRENEKADAYMDISWRNGFLCVFYTDGKVSKLKWGFAIMSL